MPSPRISSTAGTPVDNRWVGGLPPITPPPDDVNKLQVADRAQAIVRARDAGLGDAPP
jgi:hypothetical protein